MYNDKKKQIRKILGYGWILLALGILTIIFIPLLLTSSFFVNRFDLYYTGQIGDTIGGTTAPFMNLIGAGLVFLALRAQVKANELVQDQIEEDREEREAENESKNLDQLYSYLTSSINGFKFQSFHEDYLKNAENTEQEIGFTGGDAFYHLFSQIKCHFHGTEEELRSTQVVSELISILKVMELLLQKISTTTSKNKDILKVLIEHLFYYKIITRIREEDDSEMNREYCEDCKCEHGIPEELKQLILRIKTLLK